MMMSRVDRNTKDREDGKVVFVGGIDYGTTRDGLQAHMGKFGAVASCHVVTDR